MSITARDKYYLKDKKAQVYEIVYDKNDTKWWRPIAPAPLWCYTRLVSESKKYEARVVDLDISRQFVFNYNKKIEVDALIRYKGRWYIVEQAEARDDYVGDMYVTAGECPRGYLPRDNRILEYGENPPE